MTLSNVLAKSLPTRGSSSDAIRLRALERLYERKAVLDKLIGSLEDYQSCQILPSIARAPVTESLRKCS